MHTNEFDKNGFTLIPEVLTLSECEQAAEKLQSNGSPGSRWSLEFDWCAAIATRIRKHPALAPLIPSDYVATQCTYFGKSAATNWLVPIHQDLSIPVLERIDHPQLGGWSEKEGTDYVQPPVNVLEKLVAVRLHIDGCTETNGALRLVPGSHRLGRIAASATAEIRKNGSEFLCVADRGSALVMRPLTLHASSKATGNGLRRVLHFLFGPKDLPLGLHWKHVR